MLCYHMMYEKTENTMEISTEKYLSARDCPADAVCEGEKLIAGWSVRKDEFWSCVAESDGGIDDRRVTPFTYPISFQDLVLDGNAFVGVYLEEIQQILYFGKGSIRIVDKTDWAGGWGDITEGREYYFIKK